MRLGEVLRGWLDSYWQFFEHLHFKEVRLSALRFRTTFYAGILSTIMLVLLTITGVLLMYWYVPSEGGAWESLRAMEERSRFGSMVRSLHNIAAQIMLVTVVMHLVSLALRRAHERRKMANWLVGILLFWLTIALSYTGYLLPFDQLAYWAITVGANMAASAPYGGETMRHLLLGSADISTTTLLRFYVHHCITLPLIIGGLLALHLYRIRRDRGLSIVEAEGESQVWVRSRPAVMQWELWLCLCVSLALIAFSFGYTIPLGPKADPEVTPNPMKAPWYLVGLQELLHFHNPFVVSYLIPSAFTLLLGSFPFLPDSLKKPTLVDLSRRWWSVLMATMALIALVSMTWAYHVNATLILSTLAFMAMLAASRRAGGRMTRMLGRIPVLLFVLLYLLLSYLSLVLVAVYLRGPNWSLLL
jgi:quinol-cytochrome oxidoreductase complex cytochrome b subunit